jgi:hypothetical protein
MASEPESAKQPLSHARQVTIDALCEHFANDAMAMEEFERRVEVAHRAATVEELKDLLRDLPGGSLPALAGDARAKAPAARFERRVTAAAHVEEQGYVVGIMGGSTRRGRWTPARNNTVIAVMGGHELDFREALLGPGVTEVQVFVLMGGVEIVVPPWLNVESRGFAIMGGFDHAADTVATDPDGPTLRISGFAMMGGVDITVREPGESRRDAGHRRKEERAARRRLRKGE